MLKPALASGRLLPGAGCDLALRADCVGCRVCIAGGIGDNENYLVIATLAVTVAQPAASAGLIARNREGCRIHYPAVNDHPDIDGNFWYLYGDGGGPIPTVLKFCG